MTPTIFRTKRGIVVWPYEKGLSRVLENTTSSYDHVYHKRNEETGFIVPNFLGKTAFITHEQSQSFLKDQFPRHVIQDVKRNNICSTIPFTLNSDFKLRSAQEEILSTILNTRNFDDWFVNLQTGQGKTTIGVYLSSVFHYKTLITCYLSDILDQWMTQYRQITNLPLDRLKKFDGSNGSSEIDKFMKGKRNPDDYDVYLCTPGLLSSYGKRNGYDKLSEFFNLIGFGLVIFDEAHSNMGNIVRINATTNVKHTLYLSADFAQSQYKREEKYYRIFGNRTLLVQPSEETKLTMKYTDVIVVEFNTHPTEVDKLSIDNAYGYSSHHYIQYQLKKNLIFNVLDYVLDMILSKDNLSENRVLILLSNIDPVNIVYEKLKTKYKDIPVGRFHSQISSEEKESTLEYGRIIVATYSSFSTGRDLSKIKYVIGTNQSNKIEDNQAGGRARPMEDGSHVKYIMLVDVGFRYCVNKLRTRLSYLKETKMADPVKFKYTENENKSP